MVWGRMKRGKEVVGVSLFLIRELMWIWTNFGTWSDLVWVKIDSGFIQIWFRFKIYFKPVPNSILSCPKFLSCPNSSGTSHLILHHSPSFINFHSVPIINLSQFLTCQGPKPISILIPRQIWPRLILVLHRIWSYTNYHPIINLILSHSVSCPKYLTNFNIIPILILSQFWPFYL